MPTEEESFFHDDDECSHGERRIIRALHHISRSLDRIMSVQDDINAALAGDEAAITALGERVTAAQTGLESQIATLDKTIEELKAANPEVNVSALESSLANLKTLADNIDPATSPEPETKE